MSLIKKAERSSAYLKVAISGASGSGKSYSSLLLAKGLMGSLDKVCVLDTENGSANLYEHLGGYSVLPFNPPYEPKRYIKAIEMMIAEGFECLILDSITPEWSGVGGILDIHTKLGGKFQDWAVATPLHQAFIDSITNSKAHVISTLRKKEEHAMVVKNGKTVVEKLGLKEIQRDGFGYEVTLAFDVNADHLAVATKDRTGLFDTPVPFQITEDSGKKLREWNSGK